MNRLTMHFQFSLSAVALTEDDVKVDKKKLKNYKPLSMSASGDAGILRIGKNFDLISIEKDDESYSKNTYNIVAVIAMTLIKDCW